MRPVPPSESKSKDARYFHIQEGDQFDETQFAASAPNWRQHMTAWPYVGGWLGAFDIAQVMVAARHVRQLHANSTPRRQPRERLVLGIEVVHRPNYAGTYLNLGYALRVSGRNDEAAAAWKQAARLAPDDPTAKEELARLGPVLS